MHVATLDQAGNIVENTYDTGGRQTERSVTTLISGFDGAVQRIETSYLSRGLVDKVTQYDDPAAGTETDRVSYAYDGWGNVTSFTQDPDAIGSGRDSYSVTYSYSKHTPSGGPATVRRDGMSVPGLPSTSYEYWSSSNNLDDAAGRATIIRYNINQQTRYYYNGVAQLVGTDLNVANAQNRLYTGTTAYADLDNFDRVIESPWYSTSASHSFIDEAFTYDRDSNITTLVDSVHTDGSGNHVADAVYTMDNLNRLTQTRTGKIVTGAITTGGNERHEEVWVLDQQGNAQYQLDLTGDNSFSDPGEQNDTRTYSAANELLTRDLDSTPGTTGDNYTLVYDDNGNQTSNAKDKKYVWDAFGRLVKVTDLSSNLIAEYTYNGLGYRTMWWYDTTRSGGGDPDGTVDSYDPKYFFCYDDRWRVVATFRYLASDGSSHSEDPKEAFVYENAGLGGFGGTSYIDDVVIRGSDDTGWVNLSDGIGDFNYYCQDNIRHDVVAMLYSDGELLESEQYTSNGRPEGDPVGDVNGDFVYDATDDALITGAYAVTKDTNLDGVINASDVTWAGHPTGTYQALGLDVLSSAGVMNRKGYCGYESDPVTGLDAVRYRWLEHEQGRWLSRDPAGYQDGIDLYEYVSSAPLGTHDPMGLFSLGCAGGSCGGGTGTTAQPWDCAANSANGNDCYTCCNQNPGNWPFQYPCYAYCNRRFTPKNDQYPFVPCSGPGGPCCRESAGGCCATQCAKYDKGTDGIDGVMTNCPSSSGTVLQCCLCDVTGTLAGKCQDVADCVNDRFKCFALIDPATSFECRSSDCVAKQVECLRGKLGTASGSCLTQVRTALQYWEDQLKIYDRLCGQQRGGN